VSVRYPTRLLSDDEHIVREFRPHWRVLLLPILGAMLTAAVVGFAVAALGSEARWWLIGGGLGLWLTAAARPLLRWWFTNYVLTSERIIVRIGMVARSGVEIPLENITNVLFSQSITERLLGYGDVKVESAGREGRTELSDIPHPEGFQSEVYRARELRHVGLRGRPAGRDLVAQLEALADLRERGHLSDEEFMAHKAALLAEGPRADGESHGAAPSA